MTSDQGFKLHPEAARDITDIWAYIAKENPLAAGRVREGYPGWKPCRSGKPKYISSNHLILQPQMKYLETIHGSLTVDT